VLCHFRLNRFHKLRHLTLYLFVVHLHPVFKTAHCRSLDPDGLFYSVHTGKSLFIVSIEIFKCLTEIFAERVDVCIGVLT
jgi:hypothetical protein